MGQEGENTRRCVVCWEVEVRPEEVHARWLVCDICSHMITDGWVEALGFGEDDEVRRLGTVSGH